MGYHRAGFDVVGVDSCPQPNYPFEFVQGDALAFLARYDRSFSAVHASPPCQAHSPGSVGRTTWVDLIPATRALLALGTAPWVIENVPSALLPRARRLCGTQFPGLRVIRHRDFQTSGWELPVLPHGKHPPVYSTRRRPDLDQYTSFVQVTGGGNCSLAAASSAMGISWMTKIEINEAIPPAYTEYVGKHLLEAL